MLTLRSSNAALTDERDKAWNDVQSTKTRLRLKQDELDDHQSKNSKLLEEKIKLERDNLYLKSIIAESKKTESRHLVQDLVYYKRRVSSWSSPKDVF